VTRDVHGAGFSEPAVDADVYVLAVGAHQGELAERAAGTELRTADDGGGGVRHNPRSYVRCMFQIRDNDHPSAPR